MLDFNINPRWENRPREVWFYQDQRARNKNLISKNACFKDSAAFTVSYYACLRHLYFNNVPTVLLSVLTKLGYLNEILRAWFSSCFFKIYLVFIETITVYSWVDKGLHQSPNSIFLPGQAVDWS